MRLLQDAINSLAITFFGSQHHQKAIKAKGYQRYGKVLSRLNQHLSSRELQTTDSTIMSAFICVLVESFLPTGPLTFLTHLRGLEAILEARGIPKAPISRDTLSMLHGLRTLSIVGGLVSWNRFSIQCIIELTPSQLMARPCLFSRPEWKALPCTAEDENGILRCKVLDIMADCTRFMSHGAKLIFTNPAPPSSRLELTAEVKAALNQLGPLHAQWAEYNARLLSKTKTEVAEHTGIANLQTATTYMYCNLAYILLIDICQVLDPNAIRDSATNAEFAPETGSYQYLRKTAALNIIRSLQHRISARSSNIPESDTIAFFATKISWQTLGGFRTPEGRGLLHVVQQANGDLCAAGTFKEPTLELGSPCQMLWEQYPEWQKTPIISMEEEEGEGERWPLLSEYGPTTVLGDAFASAFKSWLGRVQTRGYI